MVLCFDTFDDDNTVMSRRSGAHCQRTRRMIIEEEET